MESGYSVFGTISYGGEEGCCAVGGVFFFFFGMGVGNSLLWVLYTTCAFTMGRESHT